MGKIQLRFYFGNFLHFMGASLWRIKPVCIKNMTHKGAMGGYSVRANGTQLKQHSLETALVLMTGGD